MGSIIDTLLSGGIGDLLKSAGGFAKDIRTAITGNEPLSNDQKAKLLEISSQLEQATMNANKEIALGQVEINKIEAASSSLFKSGWRPAVGWVCAAGLFYQFVFKHLFVYTFQVLCLIFHTGIQLPVMPELQMDTLVTLLIGMLGLGGYRTLEKVKGVN